MKHKEHEEEGETTVQEIARMREDIAALAANIKKLAEDKSFGTAATGEQASTGGEEGDAGEHGHEGWADIQRMIEEAQTRGEQALKDLTAEVERHPLRSIAVAAGFGFIIARLFGRGRNN